MLNSDVLHTSSDYGIHEFCPVHMKEINAKIILGMSDKTYYFSYASGIKNKNKMKQRELFNEPKHISKMSIGFDLDID